MSRLTVRTAITAALTDANLPYVGSVYPSRPLIIGEQAYEQTLMGEAITLADGGVSAVLVVNLTEDNRQRRADTGRGAVNDSYIHTTFIEVFCAGVAGDAIKTQAAYDQIIDEIIDLVRSNPTLSAPTVVWSAGEYTAGIQHYQRQPYTDPDGLTIFLPGTVKWETWEWIAGNV